VNFEYEPEHCPRTRIPVGRAAELELLADKPEGAAGDPAELGAELADWLMSEIPWPILVWTMRRLMSEGKRINFPYTVDKKWQETATV